MQKRVKDLRKGDVVIISPSERRLVISHAQQCRNPSYYMARAEIIGSPMSRNEDNTTINEHGDNTVEVE